MKNFKAESKRVLDMMINSIYTHKEIFLRELLSNGSDAIDKLYFKTLTENVSGLSRSDFHIDIVADKENKTLTISDNGIGMTEKELDNNLGTIAKSGSFDFKTENKDNSNDDINIIGQFGVGFYSAFMVSKKVEVLTKAYGAEKAYLWQSNGADGYEIKEAEKDGHGSMVTLYLKDDDDDEKYSKYLEEYELRELVKKYSDYIRYPIRLLCHKHEKDDNGEEKCVDEYETLNTMVPLWKKNKNEITQEEYTKFYKDNFYDYEDPLKTIHLSVEGAANYKALLFIPKQAAYDYYTKNFEKGLKLYTDGVLIMDKCKDLLPDYFSFVKGLVDTELTLNVSRETVQQNRELKLIASGIEKKIKNELVDMLNTDRETYEKFFKAFGLQIKYGVYGDWGIHKDMLKDLLIFRSVKDDKSVTLDEYVKGMKEDQKYIYYANGKTLDAVKALPQTDKILDKEYDVLCFTDDIDEFAIKVLGEYEGKQFRSITSDDTGIVDEEVANDEDKEVIAFIKESLGDKVANVKFTKNLKEHAVCLTSQGEISIDMEKTLNHMPNGGNVTAEKVLEINANHTVYNKINELFKDNKEELKELAEILYNQARLIAGLVVENPTKNADMIISMLCK